MIQDRMQIRQIETCLSHRLERGFFFRGEACPAAELIYVTQGAVRCVAEGKELLLEQGSMGIFDPGQWHMYYTDIDVQAEIMNVRFQLAVQWPDGLFGGKYRLSPQLEGLLQQIKAEQEYPDAYSGAMIFSLLNQLLLILLRARDGAAAEKVRSGSENGIILKAQQYIASNAQGQLSVPLVAAHAGVSASYLTALFRKNLSLSPGEYIRRVKLEQSRQMIREGELNFTQIAAALEYSTVHHFSRQFKENFGITPTEYARSLL